MTFADPQAADPLAATFPHGQFPAPPGSDNPGLDAFVALCGEAAWAARLADLGNRAGAKSLSGRAAQQRHALELALARLVGRRALTRPTSAERRICAFAEEAVRLADSLPEGPRARLRDLLVAGLTGEATLIPLFHLLRTAALLRESGFAIRFTGLAEGTPHDLVAEREGAAAEIACETVSAEEGRPLHRTDWYALVDRITLELQAWLAVHPGRYLLKMTLPEGIAGPEQLPALHAAITGMLAAGQRQAGGTQAVLKLDPLLLGGERGAALPAQLRAQFGPEAHLAMVSEPGGGLLVLAARAGRENEVAGAVARRLGQVAEARLSGKRPGIASVFLEDLDRSEWRGLRERLELEGAVRRFMTTPPARRIVAVTCASRFEMFGAPPPDAAAEPHLRFRNPAHPAAKLAALAPAILSSM
ncbi:hypothetical protein JMJ55_05430 [Belnapia sp. T6]|uniref:Uncharacterized protein n=1 Tax=Belnapia mucosa TaxID=2804532 RepID=A0ABS1UZ68_9PROT|nr:hypothetical protein [Belnapia mucosa]MBL6454755.1 hypothetical protein [Belnapia mucosa]